MSKVIILSRAFPAYHPKASMPTNFVEQFLNCFPEFFKDKTIDEHLESLNGRKFYAQGLMNINELNCKYHTIRVGSRWKVGDKFSPRIWSDKPYRSKQIIIAPDIEIKKVWDFEIKDGIIYVGDWSLDGEAIKPLAKNDGLSKQDLLDWFQYPKPFKGQIICWNDKISY